MEKIVKNFVRFIIIYYLNWRALSFFIGGDVLQLRSSFVPLAEFRVVFILIKKV